MAFSLSIKGVARTIRRLRGHRRGVEREAARLNAELQRRQLQADTLAREIAEREFRGIVERVARQLRETVPVRTGLMRRQTEARGDGEAVEIYSDATNSQGNEYAQYVHRYASALSGALSAAQSAIASTTTRLHVYSINSSGVLTRRSVIVRGSRYMEARIEGTRLVLTFESPLLSAERLI